MLLSSKWVKSFPNKPGVYVAFEGSKIVYVGETGNIRGRMKDLLDTRHHNLRRNIGRLKFSEMGRGGVKSKHLTNTTKETNGIT